MRKKMKEMDEIRARFSGEFERFGVKNGWKGATEKTVLLKNIRNENGEIISDHLWFNYTKSFKELALKETDIVQFDARVKRYEKGYKGYRDDVYKPVSTDYKLSHPTRVIKLTKEEI